RKYGIQSAMPLRTAGRLCPHAIFLEPRHHLYSGWSDRISAILRKYSPVVEMASVDEAYLDLAGTEKLHGPPLAAADALLREITTKTALPCSGGLARTRLVAKVASDQAKPRGLVWVPPGSAESFLAALDRILSLLCQKAMKRLREASLSASTITLTIRYAGFETITRAQTLREPTHLDPVVLETLRRLFDRHWDRARKVRLLGVALTS